MGKTLGLGADRPVECHQRRMSSYPLKQGINKRGYGTALRENNEGTEKQQYKDNRK